MNPVVKTLRVLANSAAFFTLLVAGASVLPASPLFGILLLLAALDQAKDVYRIVSGQKTVEVFGGIFDKLFELVMLLFGIGMLFFSIVYYTYFTTWFWRAMLFISALIIWGAVEELAGGGEEWDGAVREANFVKRR